MIQLPPPEEMARIVSSVTHTMFGISFEAVRSSDAGKSLTSRTVMLPISGKVPLTVGLSSDEPGSIKLGSAMFSVPLKEVDASMMNDSLCELVNMTAGLIRTVLHLDQALGLPKVVASDDPRVLAAQAETNLTVLRAKDVGLMLWIVPGTPLC
jgi:CheY-specific phosphatase CheX